MKTEAIKSLHQHPCPQHFLPQSGRFHPMLVLKVQGEKNLNYVR